MVRVVGGDVRPSRFPICANRLGWNKRVGGRHRLFRARRRSSNAASIADYCSVQVYLASDGEST